MVIYRPKEEQRYYYYGVDQTEVYWVHFTGNNVTNILRQHGISDDMHIIYTGTSLEYKRIFTSIINELRFCKSEYEELCVYYLMETSVYKGYKRDKIEMRGDRAEMSDFPLYLNTVAGGLDRRDQTIGGFSFVVKIYAVPVVEIIG